MSLREKGLHFANINQSNIQGTTFRLPLYFFSVPVSPALYGGDDGVFWKLLNVLQFEDFLLALRLLARHVHLQLVVLGLDVGHGEVVADVEHVVGGQEVGGKQG